MNLNLHENADLIGAVAREMTLEEPSGALRARVLAKLPERRTPRGLRLVFPLATAAALLLAWILVGPSQSTALVRPPGAIGQAEVVAAEPSTRDVTRGRSQAMMSAEDVAWYSRAVAPLPAFAPIDLPSIQPAALSIAPISVDPIVTDPLPSKATGSDAPNGGR